MRRSGRVTVTLADNATGRLTMEFPDGRVFAMKGVRESLQIDIHAGLLDCSVISPEALVVDMHVAANFPVSVQDAICAGLAGTLGWRHSNRPVRRPLSSVSIRRTEEGEEYVLTQDVPPLPRQYLRLYLSLPRCARAVAASDWRAFLQALSCESDPFSAPTAIGRLGTRLQAR